MMTAAETLEIIELLDQFRASLLDLPAVSLTHPRISAERALELSLMVVEAFEPLLRLLDDELSPARAISLREAHADLVNRSRIYLAAELAAESPRTLEEQDRRLELALTNRANDRKLFKWAWALFDEDPAIHEVLLDIRRGRGKRDDAQDVLREVEIFRQGWEEYEGRTPVTEELLDRAEEQAREQLRLLDLESVDHPGSAADMRRRAYAYWESAHDQLIRAGRYLSWADPQAERRFPDIGT